MRKGKSDRQDRHETKGNLKQTESTCSRKGTELGSESGS